MKHSSAAFALLATPMKSPCRRVVFLYLRLRQIAVPVVRLIVEPAAPVYAAVRVPLSHPVETVTVVEVIRFYRSNLADTESYLAPVNLPAQLRRQP